jgi:hypothetical protein
MKKSLGIILAGILGIMLIAAGCTSSTGTTPVTPAATTAAPMPSLPAVIATATTALPSQSWSGAWNSSYNTDKYGVSVRVLTFVQNGSSVTGTYNAGKGTLRGTVQEGTLSGTWNDSDMNATYSGFFAFERSADEKSFTGRWVNTAEGADALKNTTNIWNAVLVPAMSTTPSAAPSFGATPWSGAWNTTWLEKDGNLTVSPVSMTQTGQNVSASFSYSYPGVGNYTGSLAATVRGNTIAGTYSETDNDTGFFEFALSEDQNSFTGRWAHASAGEGALNNSTLFWNGVRK